MTTFFNRKDIITKITSLLTIFVLMVQLLAPVSVAFATDDVEQSGTELIVSGDQSTQGGDGGEKQNENEEAKTIEGKSLKTDEGAIIEETINNNGTNSQTVKISGEVSINADVSDSTAPAAPSITTPVARQWFKTAPIKNTWTEVKVDQKGNAENIDHYQVAYNYDNGHPFSGASCDGPTPTGVTGYLGCRDVASTSRDHQPDLTEEGGVTMWVRAIDASGNKGAWSNSVHYYYDHSAPETDISAPTGTVSSSTFNVSGHASDNLALNRVYVQLVNRQSSKRYGGTTIHLIGKGQNADWSQTFDPNALGLPNGQYAAHVSVVDMAGNSSTAGWTEDFTLNNPSMNNKATLNATSIVCDSESDLPNWGDGQKRSANLADEVEKFMTDHENCHYASGWNFEYGNEAANGGDTTVGHVSGYTEFGPTDDNGIATTNFSVDNVTSLHVREVLKDGYIGFGGTNTTSSNSAEFYCQGDVLHYDNWDFINNPSEGTTYNCFAFNAPVQQQGDDAKQCLVVSDETNIIVGNTDDDSKKAVETWDENPAWIKETLLGDAAKWIWGSAKVENPTMNETYTFKKTFTVGANIDSALLKIAADDKYEVKINGTTVATKDPDWNFTNFNSIDVKNSLKSGENTIEIKVTNVANDGSDPESNPAGLLYKLTIKADSCESPDNTNGNGGSQEKAILNLGVPGSVTISESALVDTSGDQAATNTAVESKINNVTPFKVTLKNTGNAASENVRIAPVNAGDHIQLWAKDTNDNWYDINVDGWMQLAGVSLPAGYDGTTDIYPLSDQSGTYDLTAKLVKADGTNNKDGEVVASANGQLIVTNNNNNGGGSSTGTTTTVIGGQATGGSQQGIVAGASTGPVGQVLGESTMMCGEYIHSYMRLGQKNNKNDVIRLQAFLNKRLGSRILPTGFFDKLTDITVRKFQVNNSEQVLVPWQNTPGGIDPNGTGYVYKTTKRWINMIECPALDIPMPVLN